MEVKDKDKDKVKVKILINIKTIPLDSMRSQWDSADMEVKQEENLSILLLIWKVSYFI